MENSSITYFNRHSQQKEVEKVYGDKAIRFFYKHPLGKKINGVLAHPITSHCYGFFQDIPQSSNKVPPFVNKFQIITEDYEKGSRTNQPFEKSFKSFNEFFIRKFKEGKREFVQEPSIMPAFCEARYLGFEENSPDLNFPVKGEYLQAQDLLGSDRDYQNFIGGPVLIARLCPVDYHRYHYPDDGKTLKHYQIPGNLHSVNPLALKLKNNIMIKNERRVAILDTKNFGQLAYVEVGATCVGKIVQTYNEEHDFKRGDEKGYFLFGGSTVILLGEKGKWKPSQDIARNSQEGLETLVQLGQEIATQSMSL